MKLISIVTPCYNEEENVEELYKSVKNVFSQLGSYDYEHIFIDNNSQDKTIDVLKGIAKADKNLKIIINTRNFGHIRSPYHAVLQARGDAVILIAADFQDPPEMILEFLKKWEEGFKIAIAIKSKSEESPLFFTVRKFYYYIISHLSEIKLVRDFNGFGLYDRQVIEILRDIDDPYPYLRGLICDIGFERAEIEYVQPVRRRGFTKNNLYTLYDMAMLGITNYSKVPLRIATMIGFCLSFISLLAAFFYFMYKLFYWSSFQLGLAPLVIGLFFFASVQLFFIGILGEYVGSIHIKVLRRPLVVEKERVNFD